MTFNQLIRVFTRAFQHNADTPNRFAVLPARRFTHADPVFLRGMLHG